MLQILSTSNETSTGPELVQNGDFSELGSDLVQNGDFAEIGSELITNGDFSATPLGSELVVNPNFVTDDISAWNIAGTPSRATKSWNASQFMRLTYDVAAGQALYDNLGHTLNAYYNVKMRVRGTKADGSTAQGSLFHSIGDLANIGVVISNPTLTSEWQDYEFNVWSTEVTFRFYLASAEIGDLVDFDSISVKENTNLVTNPNFTDTGSELVTDNDFESGLIGTVTNSSGGAVYTWALNTVSPISGTQDGKLSITSAGTVSHYPRLGFDGNLELDKSYVFTFDYKVNSGTCEFSSINRGGGASDVFPTVTLTGSGTYVYYFKPQGSGTGDLTINFDGTNLFETQFDNISVKELGEDWTAFGTDSGSISFVEDGMRILTGAAPNAAYCNQTNVMDIDKSYKFTYTISANSSAVGSGFYLYDNTGGIAQVAYADLPQTVGTHTVYFVAGDTSLFFNRYGNNADITISSIVVQELGEDWLEIVDDPDSVSFGENGLTIVQSSDGGAANRAYQTNVTEDGKSYKVTYTIHSAQFTSTNRVQYYNGDVYINLPQQSVGTHTFYYTRVGTNDNWFFNLYTSVTAPTDFVTISSISVKEVGQDWTLEDGWSIGENKAVCDGSLNKNINQNIGLITGKPYKIVFTVADYVSGNIDYNVGGNTRRGDIAANGTYTDYVVSDSGQYLFFQSDQTLGFVGSITNITVQQLDPNGYWSLGTGWSIGDLKALYDGSAVGYSWIDQTIGSVLNRSYKVTFDAVVTSGLFQFKMGSVNADATRENITISSTDSYSIDLVSGGSSGSEIYGVANAGNFVGSITNVSVKLLGTYSDQSIYVTAADVQTIPQASVYYLVELTSMASKNSIYFLPSSVVPNNGRYTKLNFTVVSKDALPTPASGIISFYDSVGGFDTYPMGFYEFRIYEQTSSTNLDPTLATGLLEKGFAFVRDFSGNMQELTDGFKEYNPTLTQYVYTK